MVPPGLARIGGNPVRAWRQAAQGLLKGRERQHWQPCYPNLRPPSLSRVQADPQKLILETAVFFTRFQSPFKTWNSFLRKPRKWGGTYILSAKYVFKSSTDCVKWSVPGCRVLIACERDFSVYAFEGNRGLFSFSLDHAPLTFTMKRGLFLNIRNVNQTLNQSNLIVQKYIV